uniref:Histone-binding protein RBBP4-like N-terminal domain-containing protein n=1 Tax=Rhodosorus marinus TaxID=101924 RepID=A0A7S3ED76_9RHOD|mmetsp:Transcript_24309/g.95681  ORF Transcript_24309/g.95681 Transcript_24309/m.95681 type:complete len:324 (+) Transcript_24309:115-1086(+)
MKDKAKRSAKASRKRRAPREEKVEVRKSAGVKKSTAAEDDQGEDADILQFEDSFDDDLESEETEEAIDGVEAAEEDGGGGAGGGPQTERRVYRPGVDTIGDNEELIHDASAYDMLHKVHVEWPALSFDFLRDPIQGSRNVFPMTAYCVIGSQAQISSKNSVTVMKMSQLHKTKRRRRKNQLREEEDEAGESSDEDSDEDKKKEDPLLESYKIKHDGAINRIRSMPQQPNIVATWSETGRVNIFDVEPAISALDRGSRMPHPDAQKPTAVKPFFVFSAHKSEGFAMDWSPLQQGRMVTGAMNRTLLSWTQREDGRYDGDCSELA